MIVVVASVTGCVPPAGVAYRVTVEVAGVDGAWTLTVKGFDGVMAASTFAVMLVTGLVTCVLWGSVNMEPVAVAGIVAPPAMRTVSTCADPVPVLFALQFEANVTVAMLIPSASIEPDGVVDTVALQIVGNAKAGVVAAFVVMLML